MSRLVALVGAAMLFACKPDFLPDDWLVTSPRVLAVKSEPAEAPPGTSVTYTAFLADPPQGHSGDLLSWGFCIAPKPPTEDNVVSTDCLYPAPLVPAGMGPSVVAATPQKACQLFGPDTPPGGFRPRDPDDTGGYYQPLRIDLPGTDSTFHLERIQCGLAQAPSDIAETFGQTYLPNKNPHLAPITATIHGETVSMDSIPVGASLTLDASWTALDAENYAFFDVASQTLATKREAMNVAWHVSAGTLETESTGRAEDDPALDSSNGWTAPSTPGKASLWIVLRDSRGGVDFATGDLTVVR